MAACEGCFEDEDDEDSCMSCLNMTKYRCLRMTPFRFRLIIKRACTYLQSDMKFERSAIDPETAASSLLIVHFFLAVRLKLNILKIDTRNIRVNTPLQHAKILCYF